MMTETISDVFCPALNTEEWKLITQSINAYIISEAVYAGCELDIFSQIACLKTPSLLNIAAAIGVSPYCASILLMCLCCAGLVLKDPETEMYANHTAAAKAFCSNTEHSFIPFVRFNHDIQQKGMSFFLNALKSGKNEGLHFLEGAADNLYDRLAESPGLSQLFHEGMAAYTHFGPKIVNFQEMGHCRRLLDIGGGNGSVSRKFLRENAALNAVLMDIEAVCQVGKTMKEEGHDRAQFVSGDIFSTPWNFQQDAILFSHLLEIFSQDKIHFLYQKAYDALPVGGRVFVWTIISNDNETGSLQAAKSSAYFLTMASGEGKAYSTKMHLELSQLVGFRIEMIYDRKDYDHLGLVLIK